MDGVREENRRLWDEWSDAFQALWNADTDDGSLPPVPCPFDDDAPGGSHPEVLDSVAGRAFVELGCGGGQASVGAALAGAETVVGVDLSTGQLAHARRHRDLYGVDARFVAGDVTDLPLPDDAFDVAFSGWVYQMVPDLDAALAEARRVLRDGGVFVFDVPHPLHELVDEETGELTRSYLDAGRREIEIDEAYGADLVVFDRPVGELHAAAVDAGFDVRRVLETADHEDDGDAESGGDAESDGDESTPTVPRNLRVWAVAE